MPIIIVFCLFGIWLYLGWLTLGFANVVDHVRRGLLAPVVGMALVTLITTTASFVGLPISQSRWVVVLLLIASLPLIRRCNWTGFIHVASFHSFFVVLNLSTAAVGLILYGTSWQGFINEDGATNSLAAQYFITHSFFAIPDVGPIMAGLDYSPLSSMLFVAGGSRFGDVMLLGLSASIFNLPPDQVYMAHALVIRCVLIGVTALFVYLPGSRPWRVVLASLVLTVSPLFVYTYVNQLISQMGGSALLVATAIMIQMVVSAAREAGYKLVWPLSAVIAALFQTYPESISLLGLGTFLFGVHLAMRKQLPPVGDLLKVGRMVALVVLALLNVSLPNVLSHLIGATGSAGVAQRVDFSAAVFGYAFTPDLLPILLGFMFLQEGLREPWMLALEAGALVLAAALTLFGVLRYKHYPLLVSLCISSVIAFVFLSWQRNGFGTFKMMLFAQPFLFALLAALIIEFIVLRKALGIAVGLGLFLITGRAGWIYVNRSITTFGPIAQLPQNRTLDKMQQMVAATPTGALVESPYFLFGKFAVLRPKTRPEIFEQNFSSHYANGSLKYVLTNFLTPLRPNQDAFWEDLRKWYQENYKSYTFRCGPPSVQATFETRVHQQEVDRATILAPGGTVVPLNRRSYAGIDVLLLDRTTAQGFLAYRPSTLGPYLGQTAAIFNVERDPLGKGSMAGVGRYILLETLYPPTESLRLALRYSRTYLGGSDTRLSDITLYGSETITVKASGGGALNLTTPPLQPCLIDGRSYILVDFGRDAMRPRKSPPWAYQLFDVPYVPDIRRVTGHLRDISVASTPATEGGADITPNLSGAWDIEAFESQFEYSGLFEDGWISDHFAVRPKPMMQRRKLDLVLDVPVELSQQHAVLHVQVDGSPLSSRLLSPGPMKVEIDLRSSPDQLFTLSVDNPLVLPRGDGRSVIGLLRSISAK